MLPVIGVYAVRDAEGGEAREDGVCDAPEAEEAHCACRGEGRGTKLRATERERCPIEGRPLREY